MKAAHPDTRVTRTLSLAWQLWQLDDSLVTAYLRPRVARLTPRLVTQVAGTALYKHVSAIYDYKVTTCRGRPPWCTPSTGSAPCCLGCSGCCLTSWSAGPPSGACCHTLIIDGADTDLEELVVTLLPQEVASLGQQVEETRGREHLGWTPDIVLIYRI